MARAALSFVLLIGFYVVLLGIAALLFAMPIVLVMALGRFNLQLLFLFALCWIPAGILVASVFATRRPDFVAPGRLLTRAEAPALFATVEELAARAGTAPPSEIYLDCLPNLAVTEVGGFGRSRRVMIVGAPLLTFLSVNELRAGIAHELGHFIGGDTRLTTFTLQTHALFASVISTVERDPFRVGSYHYAIEGGLQIAQALGRLLVSVYSRLYLIVTRPLGRRQELAADALSAAIVSAAAAASALEKVMVCAPLYDAYLQDEVGFAMRKGVMPTDLSAGFRRLRERVLSTDRGQRFEEHVRTRPTDKFDTHPALGDRLRALAASTESGSDQTEDERLAVVLMGDVDAFEAWLLDATRAQMIRALLASNHNVTQLRQLSWSEIPEQVYAPAAREAARGLCERLHPLLPNAATLGSMFAAFWQRFDQGSIGDLVLQVAPAVRELPQAEAQQQAISVCLDMLGTLLQGALLEHGATVEDSLGEPTLTLRFGTDRISVADAIQRLVTDPPAARAKFEAWANQLGSAPGAV
jgi:Zn-dependent protease with chaperone function